MAQNIPPFKHTGGHDCCIACSNRASSEFFQKNPPAEATPDPAEDMREHLDRDAAWDEWREQLTLRGQTATWWDRQAWIASWAAHEALTTSTDSLEQLAAEQSPLFDWETCTICGSSDINIHGIVRHVNGNVARIAWCSKMSCEVHRLRTRHLLIPFVPAGASE